MSFFRLVCLQGDSIRHSIGQSLGYSEGLRGNPLYSPHGLNVGLKEQQSETFKADVYFYITHPQNRSAVHTTHSDV